MTIRQARKLLGNLAEGVSDQELLKDIRVAHLLKTLYFTSISSNNELTYEKA